MVESRCGRKPLGTGGFGSRGLDPIARSLSDPQFKGLISAINVVSEAKDSGHSIELHLELKGINIPQKPDRLRRQITGNRT
jgi:hypothetical protein